MLGRACPRGTPAISAVLPGARISPLLQAAVALDVAVDAAVLVEEFDHDATQLLGVDDCDGAAVIPGHVVGDADRDVFYSAETLGVVDPLAQMLFRGNFGLIDKVEVFDRRAVGKDHQDVALLGAGAQQLMRLDAVGATPV